MPNVSSFGAQTDNAVVQGTVTDRQMIIPEVPPQGLMSVGPRATPNFVKEPWSKLRSYNFFDVVKDVAGSSYVAIKPVIPTNTELTDEEFWFKWSDPDAQLNELQEIVKTYNERISQNASAITAEVARATAAEQAEEQRATAAEATKAPTNHASEETVYGVGNAVNYGHLKLADDNTPMTSGANEGIAATPKMVGDAVNEGTEFQNNYVMPVVMKPAEVITYSMPEKYKNAKTDGFTADATHFYISRRTSSESAVLKINRSTLNIDKVAEFPLTKPGFNHMNSFTMFNGNLIVQDATGASLLNSDNLTSIEENTTCDLYKSSQIAYRDGKYLFFSNEHFLLCDYDASTKNLTPHISMRRNIFQTYCQGIDFTNSHVFASCNAGNGETNYIYIKTYNGNNQIVIAADYPIELEDIYYESQVAYIADANGNIAKFNFSELTSYYYPFTYNNSTTFRNADQGVAISAVATSTLMSQTPTAGYTPHNSGLYKGLAIVEGIEAFVYSYESTLHAIGFETKESNFEVHTAMWKYENSKFNLKETVVIAISDSNQVTKTRRTTPKNPTCIKALYCSPLTPFFQPFAKAF